MSRPAGTALPQLRANLAFFLDVDGTLLPIAETPDAVSSPAFVRTTLADLAGAYGGAVALISGRPLAELDRLFAPHRFPAAGQHGAERRDAQGRIEQAEIPAAVLDALRGRMRQLADRDPRLLLEDKGLSLALHYRRAPELGSVLQAALEQAVAGNRAVLLQGGKRVWEVRAAAFGKDQAVREFMSEPPFAGRMPVFIGDDLSDDPAFEAVNALGGISIKVGGGASAARYRLADPAAVLSWLVACVSGTPARLAAV